MRRDFYKRDPVRPIAILRGHKLARATLLAR
jgi:hypothetical protein